MSYYINRVARREKTKRVLNMYRDGISSHLHALERNEVDLDTFLFDVCGLLLSLNAYINVSKQFRRTLEPKKYLKLVHMPKQLEACKTDSEALVLIQEFDGFLEDICG